MSFESWGEGAGLKTLKANCSVDSLSRKQCGVRTEHPWGCHGAGAEVEPLIPRAVSTR